MMTEQCTEDTIIVHLPPEQEMRDKLQSVMEIVSAGDSCNVVIDFSGVDIVTSSSLSKLLRLRKLLADRGCRLVLCGLAASTKGIFTLTGLDRVFEFADDKSAVLISA
jgi:anti-anti-sigma factor